MVHEPGSQGVYLLPVSRLSFRALSYFTDEGFPPWSIVNIRDRYCYYPNSPTSDMYHDCLLTHQSHMRPVFPRFQDSIVCTQLAGFRADGSNCRQSLRARLASLFTASSARRVIAGSTNLRHMRGVMIISIKRSVKHFNELCYRVFFFCISGCAGRNSGKLQMLSFFKSMA